jgi:hypothetical protein
MTQTPPWLESRIGALVTAFADQAPTDVDPLAVARLAAEGTPRGRITWVDAPRIRMTTSFALLVAVLAFTIAAGALLVGGAAIRRDPTDVRTYLGHIKPFTGLPPEGAMASEPESGELVLAFVARVNSLGSDVHAMWLYADGRLIWRRNLEGSETSRSVFADVPPTTGVIEQRLAPAGVDLLLSDVVASARGRDPLIDDQAYRRPGGGGVWWGSLNVRLDGRLQDATWSDGLLPGRLADPGSWLPANAWTDRRVLGYVASAYALCLYPPTGAGFASTVRRLPSDVGSLFANAPGIAEPSGLIPGYESCNSVSVETARVVVGSLDRAGFRRSRPADPIAFEGDDTTVSGDARAAAITRIDILPILPHGEPVSYGG